jgi:hypothetical protein
VPAVLYTVLQQGFVYLTSSFRTDALLAHVQWLTADSDLMQHLELLLSAEESAPMNRSAQCQY